MEDDSTTTRYKRILCPSPKTGVVSDSIENIVLDYGNSDNNTNIVQVRKSSSSAHRKHFYRV